MKATLPDATFVDADLLVNWVRTVKSDTEIDVMREAGQIRSAPWRPPRLSFALV